jgi:hypothetical protein
MPVNETNPSDEVKISEKLKYMGKWLLFDNFYFSKQSEYTLENRLADCS